MSIATYYDPCMKQKYVAVTNGSKTERIYFGYGTGRTEKTATSLAISNLKKAA